MTLDEICFRPFEGYALQAYDFVRRAVVRGGMSIRRASRKFGIDRRTVRKMALSAVPVGYQLSGPGRKPKLGSFLSKIDEILADDVFAPKNQRHSSRRIYERLRDEFGYEGSYQQVREYVAAYKKQPQE